MYHQIYYTGWSTQTEPQQTGPRPSTDTQKPSQFFFLKVRKLVRPPQCHLIIYIYFFLTCYIMNTSILYLYFDIFLPVVWEFSSSFWNKRENKPQHRLLLGIVSSDQWMKMTTTVSTNRMEPIFKGHTTNGQKKRSTSAWISTFLDSQHLQ